MSWLGQEGMCQLLPALLRFFAAFQSSFRNRMHSRDWPIVCSDGSRPLCSSPLKPHQGISRRAGACLKETPSGLPWDNKMVHKNQTMLTGIGRKLQQIRQLSGIGPSRRAAECVSLRQATQAQAMSALLHQSSRAGTLAVAATAAAAAATIAVAASAAWIVCSCC